MQDDPAVSPTVAIDLCVNGVSRRARFDPRASVLDVLRESLHLTGTKKGCDHGQCGACTVLINGVRVNGCLTLAIMHEGDEITTIEGLATGEALHPLQQAFIDEDAFQCGYCTPGQIVSGVGVLREIAAGVPSAAAENVAAIPEANDAEIRERMSGNLCRCGAYPHIVKAIAKAAA